MRSGSDTRKLDLVCVFASEWSRQRDDLKIGVAGGEDVAIDRDVADGRVLDRFAVLGMLADGAGAPELREASVAIDRAAQELG